MPVISLEYEDLVSLMGFEMDKDELIERIPMIGADAGDATGDEMDIEFFPSRPDLFCVEGVARALNAFCGFPDKMREYSYEAKPSGWKMVVEPSVAAVRPYIVGAVVRGITLSDPLVQSLMNMQEKLHLTIGRKRVKVAIGVHDLTFIKPPLVYKAVEPQDVWFVPLEMDESMHLGQILRSHKKGRDYAFTLENFDTYPILMDSNNNVMSFPPIINGELTRVKEDTTDLFIDMTGTDLETLKVTLNILVTALADRGGVIESMEVSYDDQTIVTPDLNPSKMQIDLEQVRGWIGLDLTAEEASDSLKKMGHSVEVKDSELIVKTPCYRADILHPVDLMEDIAIGYGYDKFEGSMPTDLTYGTPRPESVVSAKLRDVMVGLGFQEVTTLALSNEADQFTNLGREVPTKGLTRIKNPITQEHTMLRTGLLPAVFGTLRSNKHNELPQQVFEVGDVILEHHNKMSMAFAMISTGVQFADVKSVAEAFLRELYIDHELKAEDEPPFIPGRCMTIYVGGEKVGSFGEVHPKTIHAFELGNPMGAFELELYKILDKLS